MDLGVMNFVRSHSARICPTCYHIWYPKTLVRRQHQNSVVRPLKNATERQNGALAKKRAQLHTNYL